MRLFLLAFFVVLTAVSATWHPSPADFQQWMSAGGERISGSESIPELRQKVIRRTMKFSQQFLSAQVEQPMTKQFPYFSWIPPYVANVVPGGSTVSWSAPCYHNNTARAQLDSQGVYTITVNVESASSLLCSDSYMITTLEGLVLHTFVAKGSHAIQYKTSASISPAELRDINAQGFRIFRFVDGPIQTVADLVSTLLLFGSELTMPVPEVVAKANLDFLANYRGVNMKPRVTKNVTIDQSLIHAGDFFGVIRLDGLDPMLAWAMGSTTGHTVIALRDPATNELYICESTAKDSYWPVNGIQRTPYLQWLKQAASAGYQVVWSPLRPEYQAKFNNTAAWNSFLQLEGLDYGYHTLLWGWVDTVKDNYPCIPPDFTQCLEWSHVEVLFGLLDHLVPSIADLLFTEAFNKRIGTVGLKAAELFETARQHKIDPPTIPVIVEQDVWTYNTTRNGKAVVAPSMVCCVFVCSMYKAAGIFNEIGSDINCGELTNYDVTNLDIFDSKATVPAQCAAADPGNAVCQLMGDYTLELNDYGQKKMYQHMDEACPSLPPKYERPQNC